MAVSKDHIKVSDDWLNELERLSRKRAQLSVFDALKLIANVRALKREREDLLAEIEASDHRQPLPSTSSDAMRREAWAKLGWIV